MTLHRIEPPYIAWPKPSTTLQSNNTFKVNHRNKNVPDLAVRPDRADRPSQLYYFLARHTRVRLWPGAVSNRNDNLLKVTCGYTNLQPGRPRQQDRWNEHRPSSSKISLTKNKGEIVTLIDTFKSSAGLPTYFLFVQGRRDRSIDSTKINARRSSPF